MFVDVRPRKRNAPRPKEKSARGFLQWVRGRVCAAASWGDCSGKVEAAHVDYAGDKGMGTKVSDKFAIPLCAYHHHLQHNNGWKWFDRVMLGAEGQGLKAAGEYWRAWPGRAAWEKKR
jgi:hypothetical protein